MIWDNATMMWLVLTVLFIGIEIWIPALISVWFALAAMVLTLISGSINNPMNEFYAFIVLSGVFLALTRPVVKKVMIKRKPIEERIFGQKVSVIREIEKNLYEVKLDGKYWRGVCEEKLEVGDIGVVKKIEGNKLILKKSD